MPNYRYFATYPRFFPAIRDSNGKSLMAETGMVVFFDEPPTTAEWTETDEPVTWVADEAPPAPPENDEKPAQNDPEPESQMVTPEPPEEPTGPPEPEIQPDPEPAPEPEPEPVKETPQAVLDWFAAQGQTPPARA